MRSSRTDKSSGRTYLRRKFGRGADGSPLELPAFVTRPAAHGTPMQNSSRIVACPVRRPTGTLLAYHTFAKVFCARTIEPFPPEPNCSDARDVLQRLFAASPGIPRSTLHASRSAVQVRDDSTTVALRRLTEYLCTLIVCIRRPAKTSATYRFHRRCLVDTRSLGESENVATSPRLQQGLRSDET